MIPGWLALGLQMPGTNTTPGKPVDVKAHIDDISNIIVQCDPIVFEVPVEALPKTTGVAPLSLPVDETATATAGDGAKSRSKGNRLTALT
jgi:hypothetical protein